MKCVFSGVIALLALSTATVPMSAQSGAPPSTAPQDLAAPSKTVIIQKVIVKVNGEVFTLTDLTQRQIETLRNQNKQVRNATDLQTDAGIRQALTEVTPIILMEAIDELLLVQRGREMGVKFGDEQFKQALDNIKKENKLDDAGLIKALQQEGITLQELRQNFERSYLMRGVQQQEIMPAMTITEEEKRQYYAAHPNEFMSEATVTIRELFMSVPSTAKGVSVGVDEEIKAKIDAARARAMKGEDFAKLVGELSEAGSKANGGLITDVLVKNLSPALADLLAKLKPGEITEPLRTQSGYTVFKLEARIDAVPEPFGKVRDQITAKIYEARLEGETKKFLEKLRAQALIEWKDESYKQMYEKARTEKTKTSGA
jgi:peptidyl-prolyl cis-trans isomerase SurA